MSAMYLPSPWRKKLHKDKIFQDPVKCKKQLPGDAKNSPIYSSTDQGVEKALERLPSVFTTESFYGFLRACNYL
jgi:hypothetical protein